MCKLLLFTASLMACPAIAFQLEFTWYESYNVNCNDIENISKDTTPPPLTESDLTTFHKRLTTTVSVSSTGFFHRYIETHSKKITVSGSITPGEKKYFTAQLHLIEFSNDNGPSATELTTILEKNTHFILNSEQVCTQSLINKLKKQQTHLVTTVKLID
ncbi:hypothetical protein [Zooshikella sp. RANM57]|uniref:hypothetical protein n=1 Tax=Zooshikella sp. RANM57 TaxID=3425863 RepID=UPI003D6DB0E1